MIPLMCESCGALVTLDEDGGYGCATCGHTKRPSERPTDPPKIKPIQRADVTFFVFVWGRIKAAVDKAIDEWLTR